MWSLFSAHSCGGATRLMHITGKARACTWEQGTLLRTQRAAGEGGRARLSAGPRRAAQDAAKMEAWAGGLGGAEALKPAEDGDEVQKGLAGIAARAAAGDWLYTKFFAIGLFRLLELTGAKDPKALEALVRAVGAPPDNVNRDLMTYKVRAPPGGAARRVRRSGSGSAAGECGRRGRQTLFSPVKSVGGGSCALAVLHGVQRKMRTCSLTGDACFRAAV